MVTFILGYPGTSGQRNGRLCLTPERTPKQAVCVPLGAPETPTNYVWYFIYMRI